MPPPYTRLFRDESALLFALTAIGVWSAALANRDGTAAGWAGLAANLLIATRAHRIARELGWARASWLRLARDAAALRREVVELRARSGQLSDSNRLLTELAATDGLTGLANRRRLDGALVRAAAEAVLRPAPLSVLLLDVDHFKAYNDAFGHPAGDDILRGVAARMRAALRIGDVAGRHGGEEFLAILPGADAAEAMRVAERVRCAIEAGPWPGRLVTASLGAATLGPDAPDAPALVAAADRALYAAKRRGRNRASHADDLPPAPATDRAADPARREPADRAEREPRTAGIQPVRGAAERPRASFC